MHIPKENSVSLNLLIFKKFLTNGQKETLLNRELKEKYAIKCAKNNLCFKADDCRNICLALWTFMKKVANMNKPARRHFHNPGERKFPIDICIMDFPSG